MNTLTQSNIKGNNKIYCWLLALIYFIPNINYYISFIMYGLGVANTTTVSLYIAVYLVVIFAYIKSMFKSLLPFGCLLLIFFLYVTTLAFWPQNQQYMFGDLWDAVYNPLYRIVFLGVPLFYLPSLIDDSEYLYNVFCKFAWVNLFIGVLAFFWQVLGAQHDFEYMTFSYNILFSSCLCFVEARRKGSLVLTVFSVVGLVSAFVIGSRGSMLSVLLFAFLYAVMNVNNVSPFKLLFSRAILAFVAIFVLSSFNDILSATIDVFDSIGFESRTFEKILEDTVFEDSSRSEIINVVTESIWKSPIFGNGLFGDRHAIALSGRAATYTHNILLELLCHFGVLVGGILCILYIYYSIKTLFTKQGNKWDLLYLCAF